MGQILKGGDIESMVIGNIILQGDSFGLFRAYCVKDLGCHNIFDLTYDYELRPYELRCWYYVYIHTLMWIFAISVVCYLYYDV